MGCARGQPRQRTELPAVQFAVFSHNPRLSAQPDSQRTELHWRRRESNEHPYIFATAPDPNHRRHLERRMQTLSPEGCPTPEGGTIALGARSQATSDWRGAQIRLVIAPAHFVERASCTHDEACAATDTSCTPGIAMRFVGGGFDAEDTVGLREGGVEAVLLFRVSLVACLRFCCL